MGDQRITQALQKRQKLLERLHSEGTDSYRLLHGTAEGAPGLTIDRYGPLILLQSFHEPITSDKLAAIENTLHEKLPFPFVCTYNHRGKLSTQSFEQWHQPAPEALREICCHEFGLNFLIRARHPGIDPWLFLDLRAGRRFLREHVKGLSVLNLFSYTCSIGVCAASSGAREVWNVDFAASNLMVGQRNAELNQIPNTIFRTINEDCLPVMRQLAGLPVGGRRNKIREYTRFEPHQFDLVILDPPAWSKGPFGAVDVVGDYPSLFKSAVLATKPGGRIIATNHVASVTQDSWKEVLTRCAAKIGRPIQTFQSLTPEEDFPSFDGRPPLKILVCET